MALTFNDPLTQQIVDFIASIGLEVRKETLADDTFLPGIRIVDGAIVVDEGRLAYPGDLLHEAAHLAVVPADIRAGLTDNVRESHPEQDSGEAESLAWSYAAALAAGIDPQVVFHPRGYKGRSAGLLMNFQMGVPIGVSPLAEVGMTASPARALEQGVAPFPHMSRWLR